MVFILLTILTGFMVCSSQSNPSNWNEGKLVEVDSNLYMWTDVSNVYVLRDGDAALLFDLGDGSVLEHLKDIGVKRIEWVLFTSHHREQSQGYPLLEAWDAKIAVPEEERLLFEQPFSFRKMKPSLNDTYTVHGASYVRPPVHPIKVDRAFSRMDTFTWRGHEIRCLDTRGNSPGAMSYFLKKAEGWIVFSGDVMMDGGRMHNWFDTEWDYGFASGIYAIHNAATVIKDFNPVLLLPSHGPIVTDGAKQLEEYQIKLRNLAELYLRGYDNRYSSYFQDKVSKPTSVPYVWQISPHLYKFKGTNFFPNFTLILADNGHGLVVDCGLFDETFLNTSLDLMEERLGLKKIDAVIISHMHGDHFLQAPFLKKKYGTEVWALDRMVPQIEYPAHYDYAAMIESYGNGFDSLKIDRVLKEGETFQWEGFELTADWMPGQTEFAMCLHGKIDGNKVAFTGDNIFADPDDPSHSGHEAVVAHNSAVLDEGYIYGAEYLKRLNPDLIIGGHSYIMDKPSDLIERYRQWSYRMRETFRELSSLDDYRYWFDPYWVKAEPYRSRLEYGETVEINIIVRNFRESEQTHRIEIHTPPGITASPAVLEGKLIGKMRNAYPVKLTASTNAVSGESIVAFDVTLDGKRFGEWFDALIQVKK